MSDTILDDKQRFAFGENWARFLSVLNDERIASAAKSLQDMLDVTSLQGKTFLDIGSGSGLFSLAARRLGATVCSFDYDEQSVACTSELKRRYCANDAEWRIEQGSVLDDDFMTGRGQFDVVYSWGVLHHTGAMWLAIEKTLARVADDGTLFIALYNDQGAWSRVWWLLKFLYTKVPRAFKPLYGYTVWYSIIWLNILKHIVKLQPLVGLRALFGYEAKRGMSVKHDILDWMGGFPFEVVKYDLLIAYMTARGFFCVKGIQNTGLGCHEYVFQKMGPKAPMSLKV